LLFAHLPRSKFNSYAWASQVGHTLLMLVTPLSYGYRIINGRYVITPLTCAATLYLPYISYCE
jgi:hypothetical protein